MATCKECVHVAVCSYAQNNNNEFEHCANFKDRSRFVELPCKINQKLYTHDEKCVLEAIAIGVNIIQMSKEKVKEITLTIPQIGKYFMVRQPFSDIGKKYFFTSEEAEQALKERENNG